MATKHIKDSTWSKVEKKTIEVIVETKTGVKESQMLDYIINLGIKHFNEDDCLKVIKKTN